MLNIKPIGETILPNNNLMNMISNTRTLEYKKQLLPKLIITSQSKNRILTTPTTTKEIDNQLRLQETKELNNILNSNGKQEFCRFNITVTNLALNRLSQITEKLELNLTKETEVLATNLLLLEL